MSSYNTDDLIQAIQKAPSDPYGNLLVLFDELQQVLQASSIELEPRDLFTEALTDYYLKQAQKTTAENPDTLAAHLLLIAQKALIDQLSGQEPQSMCHARAVAQALVEAQCKPPKSNPIHLFQHHWFSIAASMIVVSAVGWYGWSMHQTRHQPSLALTRSNTANVKPLISPNTITANQASAMYRQFEMMRHGNCRYLEAIQIPDAHKSVYIENVIHGKLPTNLDDLALANAYLQKISCSYTPKLMKDST